MDEATIPTWNLLPSLGFQPDDTIVFSDILPGLSLDFGNLKLAAVAVTSLYSGEIVSFSGVQATRDTLAQIEFELPRRVASLKQCAAWIVWNLDQQWDGRTFRPCEEDCPLATDDRSRPGITKFIRPDSDWEFPKRILPRTPMSTGRTSAQIEIGKVNVGVEVANQVALALGMKLSDLIREAE